MQKPERLICIEAVIDYLRFAKNREAPAMILPFECDLLVKYIDELHACNITLAQALSEVED